MVEFVLAEIFPFFLIFSIFFLFFRIFKIGVKISLILAAVLTFAIPIALPAIFDKIYKLLLEFGITWLIILTLFLFFIGLIVGMEKKKVRKLSDIEILGKLEFRKADLIGKLSLAQAKRDKGAEKAIRKEIEKVEREIKALKEKLGRHI